MLKHVKVAEHSNDPQIMSLHVISNEGTEKQRCALLLYYLKFWAIKDLFSKKWLHGTWNQQAYEIGKLIVDRLTIL